MRWCTPCSRCGCGKGTVRRGVGAAASDRGVRDRGGHAGRCSAARRVRVVVDIVAAARRCRPIQRRGARSDYCSVVRSCMYGDVGPCNAPRGGERVAGYGTGHRVVLRLVLIGGDRVRPCTRRWCRKGTESRRVGAAACDRGVRDLSDGVGRRSAARRVGVVGDVVGATCRSGPIQRCRTRTHQCAVECTCAHGDIGACRGRLGHERMAGNSTGHLVVFTIQLLGRRIVYAPCPRCGSGNGRERILRVPVQPAGAATYVSVMSSTAGFAYGEDPSVLYVKTKRTVVPAKAVRSICGRAVKPVSNGVVYVARTVPAGRVPETGVCAVVFV